MTLFPDEAVRSKELKEVWKRREVDRLLDLYLSGMDLGRLAVKLGRGRKGVSRKLQEYIYNERDRAKNYRPRHRYSRKGKRVTHNEVQIIKTLTEKGVSPEQIAAILQRPLEEVTGGKAAAERPKVNKMRALAPLLDLIWAHRYIYFGYKKPIISDETYDNLVAEEIEFGAGEKAFAQIKAYQGWPEHIKSLALYLVDKERFNKSKL